MATVLDPEEKSQLNPMPKTLFEAHHDPCPIWVIAHTTAPEVCSPARRAPHPGFLALCFGVQ